MGDKPKELCKWTREEYVREMELLCKAVKDPKYVCSKCGRAARKKKWLCKPEDLK